MKLKFIPPSPDLAECWFLSRQDPITLKFNPLSPASIEELKKRLADASFNWSDFDEADHFIWFIELEGNVVGSISLQNINRKMLTAEIGYGVFSEYRGKSIAKKAVGLLVKNTFQHSPLRKLVAFVHVDNLASRKVLENVGFVNEGLLREHFIINGKAVDEIIYGYLKKDHSN